MNKFISKIIFNILLLIASISLLTACGGGGGEATADGGDSDNQELVLGEGYDEKVGDIFTTSFTINAAYSNGQTAKISSVNIKTYSQVNEIPSKYGYSNSISGPYLLESTKEDGVLDGLEYMTNSGRSIIDDGNMTLSKDDLTASFSAETILQNYFISQNNASVTAIEASGEIFLSFEKIKSSFNFEI